MIGYTCGIYYLCLSKRAIVRLCVIIWAIQFYKEDMKLYREHIQKLRKEESAELFLNAGPDHAAVVSAELFLSAKEIVRIVSRNLSEEVTGREEYLSALETYLSKDETKLEIILTDYNLESYNASRISRVLSRYDKDKVELLQSSSRIKYDGWEANFMIVDKRGYRLELNTEKRKAVGSFNEPGRVEQLQVVFEKLKGKSKPI